MNGERARIKTLNFDGRICIVQRRTDLVCGTRFSIKVTSESPEHALSSVRKKTAYKRELLERSLEVKSNYTKGKRNELKKLFAGEYYKRAIGLTIE